MAKQNHDIGNRKRKHAQQTTTTEQISTDRLAESLVHRGLAGRGILDIRPRNRD